MAHSMAKRPPTPMPLEASGPAADWRWTAVSSRDRACDGQFVYAVSSTRIFCRPSCPSRRPHRERVTFFTAPADAVAAGYRACKRCRPESAAAMPVAGDAIRQAASFLIDHADEPVALSRLASVTGVSAFHLQRRFRQALGLSPREFHAACRAKRFRQALREGQDVTAAIYAAGYGSPSRVYEGAPTGRGMSPAAYRRGGAGADIGFVIVSSPLGSLLVAATAKGVCAVKLGDTARAVEADLRDEFPRAQIRRGAVVDKAWVDTLVRALGGASERLALPLDVQGTAFQWRVWLALQRIAPGETRSYSDVARAIGQPDAARAVARACAANPVCLLIPCHRVVGKDGRTGGYRWGAERKARLLNAEKKRSKIPPQ